MPRFRANISVEFDTDGRDPDKVDAALSLQIVLPPSNSLVGKIVTQTQGRLSREQMGVTVHGVSPEGKLIQGADAILNIPISGNGQPPVVRINLATNQKTSPICHQSTAAAIIQPTYNISPAGGTLSSTGQQPSTGLFPQTYQPVAAAAVAGMNNPIPANGPPSSIGHQPATGPYHQGMAYFRLPSGGIPAAGNQATASMFPGSNSYDSHCGQYRPDFNQHPNGTLPVQSYPPVNVVYAPHLYPLTPFSYVLTRGQLVQLLQAAGWRRSCRLQDYIGARDHNASMTAEAFLSYHHEGIYPEPPVCDQLRPTMANLPTREAIVGDEHHVPTTQEPCRRKHETPPPQQQQPDKLKRTLSDCEDSPKPEISSKEDVKRHGVSTESTKRDSTRALHNPRQRAKPRAKKQKGGLAKRYPILRKAGSQVSQLRAITSDVNIKDSLQSSSAVSAPGLGGPSTSATPLAAVSDAYVGHIPPGAHRETKEMAKTVNDEQGRCEEAPLEAEPEPGLGERHESEFDVALKQLMESWSE